MASKTMNVRQATNFQLPDKGFSKTVNGVSISIHPVQGRKKTIVIERTTWEQYICSHRKPISSSLGSVCTFDSTTGQYAPVSNPIANNTFILLRNPTNNRLIIETRSEIAISFLHILKKESQNNNQMNIVTSPFSFNFHRINASSNSMKNLSTKSQLASINTVNYSGPSIGHTQVVTQAINNSRATHTIVDITINGNSETVSIGQTGQVYFLTNVWQPRVKLSQLLSII